MTAVIVSQAIGRVRSEERDYIMAEEKEFGGYSGNHHYADNNTTFEYGIQRNGSPCLRIEIAFEEDQEERMAAVGALIEDLLKALDVIEEPDEEIDNPEKYTQFANAGL